MRDAAGFDKSWNKTKLSFKDFNLREPLRAVRFYFYPPFEFSPYQRPPARCGASRALAIPRYADVPPNFLARLACAVPPRRAVTGEPLKKRRILYVEDDPALRMSTCDMLDDMGHEVIEAPDAPAALQWLREGHQIDLLLTDLKMPLMNGRELAAEARLLRPGLTVVYTTGASDKSLGETVRDGRTEYLFKPFGFKELDRLFRALD
ncbi:MAG: response regulator [Alphaproteobacteria bacterium]